MFRRFLDTDAAKTTILIRVMVGTIILSEGIQKILYPALRGAGRFEEMGFSNPEFVGYFLGSFEIFAGLLIVFGFLTRAGTLITLTIISVTIIVAKIPIALGESLGPFILPDLSRYGFWSMAHEMRIDFALWFGSLFLLIKGGGRWSCDRQLYRKLYSFKWDNKSE